MENEREVLLQQVDDVLNEIVPPVIRAAVNGVDPTALAVAGTEKVTDFILADRERTRIEAEHQNILLKADIAYAIGRFEGLDYPSEYLKRRYPEYKTWANTDAQPTHKAQEADHAENS